MKCCAKNDDPRVGKGIHGWILRNGIEMDVVLQNAMIDFYAKCGAFWCARNVFEMMAERDTVSWNVMIGAHLLCGDANGAMELFRASPSRDVSSWNTFINGQMQIGSHRTAVELLHLMVKIGPTFNQYTLSIGLVLAAKLALLHLGKQIHNKLLRLGFENDAFILNSLINMYCKCGKMETSSIIFNELKQSCMGSLAKTISWSSLITGFFKNGRSEQALELFCRMLHQGAIPDPFTLTSVAAACASAGFLVLGKQIHACIQKLGHGLDMFLASAVIDMYAKCGSLDDARKTFDVVENKNVVLWTSMVGSYARHGEGREAIRVFEMMIEKNIKPNEISFLGVLSACSHEGLVEEGYKYFILMQNDYGMVPTIEHLTSMVDLLCRSGQLDEAKNFIQKYNLGEYSVVWKALLSACRVHSDMQTARWASEQLVQIQPHEAGSYILLSNACSTKREWVEASKLWSAMKNKGIKKQPGSSWI
ncbi:hypothetical protein HPP92_025249 [Vanilla planifolia]|uniref:Pentatricopeptide repeat-containing protein n=1 Tax=Vanilla planifolia TaxID=51239 RepID=A0A835PF14_VANPL|nr:hypothetical protein HPP92_025249 [Vanilla planifolia]